MSFTAQYHGTCTSCDGRIKPGQECRYDDDEIEHVKCPEEEDPILNDTPARNERRCGDCFTIHAGPCM